MTEKIYYADVMTREFTAVVKECREEKKRFEIVLDRTAFYPEGGGQPGDTGVLVTADEKTVRVMDTHEKGDVILHYTDQPLEEGVAVTGRIDWDRRFELMQSHTGEHIVSGLINAKYHYNNVGFHMGSECMTIDLDGMISWEELKKIELEANRVVWMDVPVGIEVYDQEQIKTKEYRSKKELTGDVRLVSIPQADVCACCGTHLTSSGQVGLIKLLSVQKFKEGVRIEMLCGRAAYAYMDKVFEENKKISALLSAKPLKTADAVEKLKRTAAEEAFRCEQMERAGFARTAASLKGCGNVLVFQPLLSPDGVRRLADEVMQVCGGLCAVFSGKDEDGYKYAVGEKDGDVRAFVKDMNETLGGHGGGRPYFAQGSVNASGKQIEAFFESCEQTFRTVDV